MNDKTGLDAFTEHIQNTLENSDPRSFNQLKRSFLETFSTHSEPFKLLIQKLTGKTLPNSKAISFWYQILENKAELEKKLGRRVGIQTAAVDYVENNLKETSQKSSEELRGPKNGETVREKWFEQLYSPGYHLEKLKEEILRSKRYKHALSAIMLDIDEFHKVNELFSYDEGDKILGIIVKIIRKTIRTVDVLARYSGDRFLIILPYTNRREAMELAERLRQNVVERTSRIQGLNKGITLTLSVAQCNKETTSTDLMKQLEHTLIEGKRKERNALYVA